MATSGTPPTSRSGHRMVLLKKHLVIFGGFHDNLSECKYFNDVHVFSLEERCWRKVATSGAAPGPRSGCCLAALQDGRILVYGGFCKEKKVAGGGKKKDMDEEGKTMGDMYLLAPESKSNSFLFRTPDKKYYAFFAELDETLSKWRWLNVKQIGSRPCPRSGISSVAIPESNKVLFFGGVQDSNLDTEEDSSDEEDSMGNFFNDLYSVSIENERATWNKVELCGKKDPLLAKKKRRNKDEEQEDAEDPHLDDAEDAVQDLKLSEPEQGVTKVVEDGAFTISSTVGLQSESGIPKETLEEKAVDVNCPSPRFGSQLAIKQGVLYLFGGMVEDDDDRQLTHKDLYSIGKNFT